ncbi:MAG: DUF3596 domain-containing protein [Nodosilinea sp.]
MPTSKTFKASTGTAQPEKRPQRRKTPEGSVSIRVSNGWLRLYWTYQGKANYCYLGAKNTPTNREPAKNRAELLAVDLKNGTFDPTKAKYRLFPKEEV